MTQDLKQAVLDAFEVAAMSMTFSERYRALEESVALYGERGFEEIAVALEERLASAKRAMEQTE